MENLVLLVEDDALLRRSLERFLNLAGYAFDSCSTASEALNLAQEVPPHVVIAEYHLPDANGPSFIGKLNLVAPEAVTIVLSEYDFRTVADDLGQVKIKSFLKKPFDLVDFEAALSLPAQRRRGNFRKGGMAAGNCT